MLRHFFRNVQSFEIITFITLLISALLILSDLSSTENSIPWVGDKFGQNQELEKGAIDKEEGGKRGKGGGGGGGGGKGGGGRGVPMVNGRSNGGFRSDVEPKNKRVSTAEVVATSRSQWKTFDEDDDEVDVNDPKFEDGDRTGKQPAERNGHLAKTHNQPQRSQQPPPRPPPPVVHNTLNGSSFQRRRHYEQETDKDRQKAPVMMEMQVMELKGDHPNQKPQSGDFRRTDYNSSLLNRKNEKRLQYGSDRREANGQTQAPKQQVVSSGWGINDDGKWSTCDALRAITEPEAVSYCC